MLKKYLLFCLFVVFFKAFSQPTLKYNEDVFTFNQLNDSLNNTVSTDKKHSFFLDLYLKKAKKNKNNIHLFEAYYKLSGIAQTVNDTHAYADSLLLIAKKLPKDYYIKALQSKATAFYFEKDYINSLTIELNILNEINKEQDPYSYYKSMYSIGLVYFHIQEYHKALRYFNQARTYFENQSSYTHIQGYFNSLYREAFTLYYLKRHEESMQLITAGLQKINLLNPDDIAFKTPYFNYILGLNLYQERQYKESIDLLKTNIFAIKAANDFANEATINYYIGLNYWHLNNKEEAVLYLKKTDNAFNTYNYSNLEIKDAYTYLINYYRNQKNVKEELYYTNQFLEVMKYLQTEYKKLSGTLHNTIDIKSLINDKERLEKDLNKKSVYTQYFTITAIIIAIILLLISAYNYRKKKEFLKNYNDLLQQREHLPVQVTTDEIYPIIVNSLIPLVINTSEWRNYTLSVANNVKETPVVDEKISRELIANLNDFEKNNLFLSKDINLNDLAIQWNTNRTYLSQFINSYKQKSFIDYLNSLRIAYFLDKVDSDKKWSKYKVQAISELLGFSSARAFSGAFMKSTGISPSFYLQQISLQKKDN